MDLNNFLSKLNTELGLEEADVPQTFPGAKVPKKKKTELIKRARKGEDLGKKGKSFKEIAAKAATRYGSKKSGDRVAGAQFWKMAAKGKI